MKSWFKIILIPLLLYATTVEAQVGLNFDQRAEAATLFTRFNDSFFDYKLSVLQIKTDSGFQNFSSLNQSFNSFPNIYNYHNLAFFCKVEVKMEKAAKFPVKFRLGDVNYVDQLEGK
jgi:hypothetical protein